jgi:hypothetical protein
MVEFFFNSYRGRIIMALNFIRHPIEAVAAFVADPVEFWTTVYDRFVYRQERNWPQWHYEADKEWEHHLHGHLGVPWPCSVIKEFYALLPEVLASRGDTVRNTSFHDLRGRQVSG